VVLVEDETILRLFPPLRMAWAPAGEQASVPITGYNARRVLYGAMNIHTGHRVVYSGRSMRQAEFHVLLKKLKSAYRGRGIWLVLDKHGSHDSIASRRLAAKLGIELLWLPRQSPELNPMDHLWRETKRMVSANWQYDTVDAHAQAAETWIQGLTNQQALRKAGALSKNFWLIT
jgi:transposase